MGCYQDPLVKTMAPLPPGTTGEKSGILTNVRRTLPVRCFHEGDDVVGGGIILRGSSVNRQKLILFLCH